VADEDAGGVGQGIELAVHRVVERLGVTEGEVAATRAVVLEEDRVTGENGVADEVRQTGRRVAGRGDGPNAKASGRQDLSVIEQPVELAAIDVEGLG
jgi:hypothetical protein